LKQRSEGGRTKEQDEDKQGCGRKSLNS